MPPPYVKSVKVARNAAGQPALLLTTVGEQEYLVFPDPVSRLRRWHEIQPNPYPERDRYPRCFGARTALLRGALEMERRPPKSDLF